MQYIEQLISYKGNHSSKTAYKKYDVCLYNGSAYLCISDSGVGILPTNTSHWVQITLQGERGFSGWGLSYNGSWSATTSYNIYDCVTYNNCLYASIYDGDNLGKTPGQNSDYWSLVFDISLFTVYDNSSSNLNSTSLQSAIDEVNLKVNSNTNKLNTVENGAQKNTITGIKGSSESNYRTGNVNITPANLGITVVNNTADKDKSVATANNANSVNGFKFTIGTTDLEAGVSSLTTNTFYFVYE